MAATGALMEFTQTSIGTIAGTNIETSIVTTVPATGITTPVAAIGHDRAR